MCRTGNDRRRRGGQAVLLGTLSLLVLQAASADGPDAVATRGRAIYETYCALCHGSQGVGDGRAAGLQRTRPTDLTLSTRSDAYKVQIIRLGGAAMQRSSSMPPWSDVLSEQQIQDVVAYLRTLVQPRIGELGSPVSEPGTH